MIDVLLNRDGMKCRNTWVDRTDEVAKKHCSCIFSLISQQQIRQRVTVGTLILFLQQGHSFMILFTEEGGKTKAIAHIQFSNAEALKVVINMGMQQGMNTAWDYLIGYVQQLQAH
jgi:hypothetical protein